MNEIFGFIAETVLGNIFGKLTFFESPLLFLGLLAVVLYFRIDEPLKESTGKKVCLFFIAVGLVTLLI